MTGFTTVEVVPVDPRLISVLWRRKTFCTDYIFQYVFVFCIHKSE